MVTKGRVIVINPFCDCTRFEYFQTVEAPALPAGLDLTSVMDGTLMSFDNIHYRNNLAVNFPYKAPLKPRIGAHPICRGFHSLSLNSCQE